MNPRLAALLDRLRFLLTVVGWPGLAGLALLLAAAVGQWLVLPQQQAATVAARAQAERNHQDYLRRLETGDKGELDAATKLARFREALMPEARADEALETVQQLAQKHGLSPAGTEYKWRRQADARLAEVEIVMPLKAGYVPLHDFVSEALDGVPGLAIAQFDMQRDAIGNASVDARLRFSLYLRAGA